MLALHVIFYAQKRASEVDRKETLPDKIAKKKKSKAFLS